MIVFHWDKKTVKDIKKMAWRVDKAQEALEDRSQPMEKIKKRQINRWITNFDGEGRLYGEWAELAGNEPFTSKNKSAFRILKNGKKVRRAGMRGAQRAKPLHATGALRRNFVWQSSQGEVTNDAINWEFSDRGPSGFYSVYQHGGIDPNKGLYGTQGPVPARTIWALNEADEDAVEKILEDWVTRILERYFGV